MIPRHMQHSCETKKSSTKPEKKERTGFLVSCFRQIENRKFQKLKISRKMIQKYKV
eukprot:TRINITY_DN16924_c0_g1_i1.p2 TRINITY_DN16924_c0_g1~~TRINITY_DN16924_c0_g1_i1.p2  ORF type:complete len:56 (-),score=6.17 TRINITY_DN16924_c0_g1_i1:153-320(-)